MLTTTTVWKSLIIIPFNGWGTQMRCRDSKWLTQGIRVYDSPAVEPKHLDPRSICFVSFCGAFVVAVDFISYSVLCKLHPLGIHYILSSSGWRWSGFHVCHRDFRAVWPWTSSLTSLVLSVSIWKMGLIIIITMGTSFVRSKSQITCCWSNT